MDSRNGKIGLEETAAKIAAGQPKLLCRGIAPDFGGSFDAGRAATHLIAL
jgi:hypothetical protein